MNKTINSFLRLKTFDFSLNDVKKNTETINDLIRELKKAEEYADSIVLTSGNEINILENKINPILISFSNNESLLANNQELFARLERLKAKVTLLRNVVDFAKYIASFKSIITDFNSFDEIENAFGQISTEYNKYKDIIDASADIYNLYLDALTQYNYLKANEPLLTEVLNAIKSLSISDDNYDEELGFFRLFKARLIGIYDELLLPRVEEILYILNNYVGVLEEERELSNKIDTIINLINESQWDNPRFLEEVVSYAKDFENILKESLFSNEKIIDSKAHKESAKKLVSLNKRIETIKSSNKSIQKIIVDINKLKSGTDIDKVNNKIETIKKNFNKIAEKKHYLAIEQKINNLPKEVENIVLNAVNEKIDGILQKAKETESYAVLLGLQNKLKNLPIGIDRKILGLSDYSSALEYVSKKTRKAKFKLSHSAKEWYFIPITLIVAALCFGYLYFYKTHSNNVINWLYTNPPYFSHEWAHWGLGPWKWVENSASIGNFLVIITVPLTFIVAVVCMLFALLAEAIWSLIVLIAFLLSWLVLSIFGVLIWLLQYAFMPALAFGAIFLCIGIAVDEECKFTFSIINSIAILALCTLAFLVNINVLNWWR